MEGTCFVYIEVIIFVFFPHNTCLHLLMNYQLICICIKKFDIFWVLTLYLLILKLLAWINVFFVRAKLSVVLSIWRKAYIWSNNFNIWWDKWHSMFYISRNFRYFFLISIFSMEFLLPNHCSGYGVLYYFSFQYGTKCIWFNVITILNCCEKFTSTMFTGLFTNWVIWGKEKYFCHTIVKNIDMFNMVNHVIITIESKYLWSFRIYVVI